jgi:hemerythrin-like domain-containing protein
VAGLLLEELNTMPEDNPEWMAKFMMLKEMLEHHIEEEEQEIFRKAKRALSNELAEDLGNTMRHCSLVVKAALEPVHVRH